MQPSRHNIGIDIGGTFTDFVACDTGTGALSSLKIPTSPEDPARAVFEGLEILRDSRGLQPADTAVIVHATTLATNTLIEGTGARVALIASGGFRDILEMRRETRYDDYDLTIEFPEPLVPRRRRHAIAERVLADGTVRVPLDEAGTRSLLANLRGDEIEALAVCLMHSWKNPWHEERIGAMAADILPAIPVSLSSQVQPEIREYERMVTTVANAYVQPRLQQYLLNLTDGLSGRGYASPFYVMQSNGGFASPEESTKYPVRLIESGPAAGAIAAAAYARASGEANVVSLDMGGTTAKIAVLRDGQPRIATEIEVARVHRFKKGSGYPIKCPSVELSEIGAGGGSVAGVDSLGLVRVGPQSAGALPGPACYANGGLQPTVTDANLALGYIDPDFFAGGRMRLDRMAALAAIRDKVAKPAKLDEIQAAWGIHEIVNENMATAARLHILERGEDPRQLTMVAFGGAGPIHAHRVAAKLGIPRILYPLGAGVASAHGLLDAPMSRDLVRTYPERLDAIDWDELGALYGEMEGTARGSMGEATDDGLQLIRLADMRYSGQGYEIQVPSPPGPYSAASRIAFESAFLAVYERIFGRRVTDVPIEMVNLRLFARRPGPSNPVVAHAHATAGGPANKGERPVYFGQVRDFVACPVHDRYRLERGTTVSGPAIVEEFETSVVIEPGRVGVVDQALNVVVNLS